MSLFVNISKYLWPQIRKHKWSFYLGFVFYATRVFFAYILSVVYFKKIIDIISEPSLPRELLISPLIHLVIINILIMTGGNIFARLTAWSVVYFQSNTMKELSDYSFGKIINNSYNFFSNRFIGSLVTKSRRFVRAFETMHDLLVYNFLGTLITLLCVFVVLFTQASFIALILFSWFFIYIISMAF